jgi:polysaccharide pyruvyl transferase WcaK-like protein/chemotaxis methyl-accepting protein methylase
MTITTRTSPLPPQTGTTAAGKFDPPRERSPARLAQESIVSSPVARPQKISFFGHFGSANSGNESTLISILYHLRALSPETDFLCVCSNPEAAVKRYGIAAIPISTRTRRIWDRDTALAKRVPMALVGAGAELRQYTRALRELEGTDVLIVPGTGLVTDAFGLHNWGPYSMFTWVLMAKLRRTKVEFVSIGAGPIESTSGRALVKATLSLADYRSYRDRSTKEYLGSIGFRTNRDPVYPDLVFGLPQALLPREEARPKGTRRVVGLGLMVYPGKYSASDPRPETYRTYLESLAAFAVWLLDHDYDIRLLLGDADTIVIEDFKTALRARVGSYDERRIIERPIASVEDVLAELGATDLVVATRFHNVLLALLVGRPVIAISFHHKCSSLMEQMDLSDYCHEIEQLNADWLIHRFRDLERNQDALKETIRQGVDEARAALDDQYRSLFAGLPSSARRDDARRPQRLRRRLDRAFLRHSESIWHRLPGRVRDRELLRAYGRWSHARVCGRADREMHLGTVFLRNRPALELMRRLVSQAEHGARVRIVVLGCSIGVEVYSILWTLRSSRPDLELEVHALDISPELVRVAEQGVYSPAQSAMVASSIFEGLTEAERAGMFDWDGDAGRIKPWLRDGVTWQVGDASDPRLVTSLGPSDLVIANNFLCHMPPASARQCLRNLARLVRPDGYLFVAGVDLDVRTEVALEREWEAVRELRAEIHDGDPLVRSDWPWRWWGLEPLDRGHPEWETRYSTVFRVGTA